MVFRAMYADCSLLQGNRELNSLHQRQPHLCDCICSGVDSISKVFSFNGLSFFYFVRDS